MQKLWLKQKQIKKIALSCITDFIPLHCAGMAPGLKIWGGEKKCVCGGGHILPILVEIGLTGLSKSGGCLPPRPPVSPSLVSAALVWRWVSYEKAVKLYCCQFVCSQYLGWIQFSFEAGHVKVCGKFKQFFLRQWTWQRKRCQRWLNFRKFSLWLKSPKMGAKAHTPEHLFFYLDSTQGSDLAHILWDLSQNEKILRLRHL